jgi:hypothetical protein
MAAGWRVAQAVLAAKLLTARGGLLPDPQRLLQVVRVSARRKRHPDVRRPAGEAQPTLVHEGDFALGVRHPHECRRGVGQLAELRLAVAHHVLVAGAVARRPKHARDGLEEAALVGVELAWPGAERLDPAGAAPARLDRRAVGAGRSEVVRECRGTRLVALDHGHHALEHASRQPHAGPHQETAAVVRQLEQGHLLHLELAGHRGDRGVVQLLERHSLERALGKLGHRRLSVRP